MALGGLLKNGYLWLFLSSNQTKLSTTVKKKQFFRNIPKNGKISVIDTKEIFNFFLPIFPQNLKIPPLEFAQSDEFAV